MLARILWSAARIPAAPRPQYPVLAFVVLGLVLAVGLAVAYSLRREASEDEEPVTDADLLAGFERARFSGEMDEEEFQRVSASLRKRMAASTASGIPTTGKHPKPAVRAESHSEQPATDLDAESHAEPPADARTDPESPGPEQVA